MYYGWGLPGYFTPLVLFCQYLCDRDNVNHCRLNILGVAVPQASVFWLRTSFSFDRSRPPLF